MRGGRIIAGCSVGTSERCFTSAAGVVSVVPACLSGDRASWGHHGGRARSEGARERHHMVLLVWHCPPFRVTSTSAMVTTLVIHFDMCVVVSVSESQHMDRLAVGRWTGRQK